MSDFALPPALGRNMQSDSQEVQSFQQREAVRARRVSRLALGSTVFFAATTFILAATLFEAVPLIRVVPVFVWARPDGTADFAVSQSSLPGTLNEAQKRAWLWQYVQAREAYSATEAAYHYNVVSAMSAADVRDEYQKWMNGKQRPSAKIGAAGTVRLEFRESKLSGNTFEVHFYRVIKLEGQQPKRVPYHVLLTYSQEASIPALDRITFNPAGLVVTAYPGPEPDGTDEGATP